MDDKTTIRDLLLVGLVALLIWYLFRAERNRMTRSGSFSSGESAGSGSGPSSAASSPCGGQINPAISEPAPPTSVGGQSLSGPAGFQAPHFVSVGGSVGGGGSAPANNGNGGGSYPSTQWYAGSGPSGGTGSSWGN